MGRLIEGLWDCCHCGTTGIGGSKRECPGCGKPRDENTVFYMGEKKKYVPKMAAKKVNRNPDWVCGYCGSLNSDNSSDCTSCGCTRGGENLDYFENRGKKVQAERAKEATNEDEEESEDAKAESSEQSYGYTSDFDSSVSFGSGGVIPYRDEVTVKPMRKPAMINFKPIAIALAVILLIAGLVYLFIPKEKEVTITSTLWERVITIEEYKTVRENDWSVPHGGRLQYTRQEISHYQNVLDHYETKTRQVAKQRYVGTEEVVTGHRDLGNGYFEEITSSRPVYETYYETETYQDPVYRSEPVYRTKYYYDIERWVYCRSVSTSGNDQSPYWGEVRLAAKERESSRAEQYWITGLDEKEKELKVTLSYSDWSSIRVGQVVRMKVSLGHGELIRDEKTEEVYEQE
ncbi:MAG: hypothetical protein IJX99_04495 [Clostridia bacterium]|nr:hypothetical protein [Clostridia bacterium]